MNVAAEDVLSAFNLTKEQTFVFLKFSKHIDELQRFIESPMLYKCPEQLMLCLDGGPGSGKSHVLKCMQMYLFQKNMIGLAKASAQTAKAALNMSTPVLLAETNHSLFALGLHESDNGKMHTTRMKNSLKYLKAKLYGILILFLDESSMISTEMFGMMNMQLQLLATGDACLMGGRIIIMFGDQAQLAMGRPLYKSFRTGKKKEKLSLKKVHDFYKEKQKLNYAIIGRQVWLHFKRYQFYNVKRYLPTKSGEMLAEIVMAWRYGKVFDKHIDWLQSRWIGSTDSNIDWNDKSWRRASLFHPRNQILDQSAPILDIIRGLSEGRVVFIWQAIDLYADCPEIPLSPLDYKLLQKLDFKQTGCMKTFVFSEGCVLIFNENKYKWLKWIHQNECTGVSLKLHPSEPPLDKNQKVHLLKLHPTEFVVHVENSKDAYDFGFGPGNIKLMIDHKKIKLMRDNRVINIVRHGFIDLYPACVKSDFGCQCITIYSPEKYLTDLTIPATGALVDGSFIVIISRGQEFSGMGLLAPLFVNLSERITYMKNLKKHIELSEDKRSEMLRFEEESKWLIEENKNLWREANRLGNDEGCIKFPSLSEYEANSIVELEP